MRFSNVCSHHTPPVRRRGRRLFCFDQGGWANISARAQRSTEQIGRTLSGCPQLAGEARLAAAQITHVARRLLLDERLPPFRQAPRSRGPAVLTSLSLIRLTRGRSGA